LILRDNDMPTGRLYAYDGKVTIDEHLSGQIKPAFVLPNLIVTVGKTYILENSPADIDEVKLGDGATARTVIMTDIVNELFSAAPTDARVTGTKRITELFVGVSEANFTHREIGIFANSTLISTLVITPEFEKTTAKTRTYIHELGWL